MVSHRLHFIHPHLESSSVVNQNISNVGCLRYQLIEMSFKYLSLVFTPPIELCLQFTRIDLNDVDYILRLFENYLLTTIEPVDFEVHRL